MKPAYSKHSDGPTSTVRHVYLVLKGAEGYGRNRQECTGLAVLTGGQAGGKQADRIAGG